MPHSDWKPGFHLTPHQGWLNDPNGLCQMDGEYHVFYQYGPDWPTDDLKSWGHYASRDLIHWEDLGCALSPDHAADRTGVFSGSAVVAKDETGASVMRLYYTGNVILADKGDGVHTGREANELLVESSDGRDFGPKHLLLTNADYPVEATLHVRDPKVWEQDGAWHMILGMRTNDDEGQVIIYDSLDGLTWEHRSTIAPNRTFGFMWECPNIVQLDGHDFLAVCPQGVDSQPDRYHNLWQAGYMPLDHGILDETTADVDAFVEWDHGYDYYAPQIFVDESGRTISIGWMGTFDKAYTAFPDGLDWAHCLTIPRVVTLADDGLLLQNPVPEIDSLRGAAHDLASGEKCVVPGHSAQVVIDGITSDGSVTLDDALTFAVANGRVTVSFSDDDVAAGRTERSFSLDRADTLSDLRVFVDASTVEVYANNGRTVFSTRWFPKGANLTVATDLECASATVHEMDSFQIG